MAGLEHVTPKAARATTARRFEARAAVDRHGPVRSPPPQNTSWSWRGVRRASETEDETETRPSIIAEPEPQRGCERAARTRSLGTPSLSPRLAADDALDSTTLSFLLQQSLEAEKEEEKEEEGKEERKRKLFSLGTCFEFRVLWATSVGLQASCAVP